MYISHAITGVGDRYITEKMVDAGAVLGGEDSGHIVFLGHQITGDGILPALKMLEIMVAEDKPLFELTSAMTVFSQVLINVDFTHKLPLGSIPEIETAIRDVENEMPVKEWVLVRHSGTQPQCRVIVEGPNAEDTENLCNIISQVFAETIGT
jgi:phosphoglucosamine mutase